MPLRVLQVHTRYRQPGGEDKAVATEGDLLRAAGHVVIPHTAMNPEGAVAAGRAFGAAPWNLAAARQLRDVAIRVRPDVVHAHNTWFSLSPAIFGTLRRLGVPVVLTLHNYRLVCAAGTLFRGGKPCTDCVGTSPWHAVEHGCYRASRLQSAVAASTIAASQVRRTWHRDVDRFLALTDFGRQQFIAGGLPAGRIEVKSNSVSDPGIRARPPSASTQLVFIGRLSEEKGVSVLLDAWRSVPAPFELIIAGAGPLAPQLMERAPERVTFLGSVWPDRISELLLNARALVFPSIWYEGQGLVALEAAAAGLPVLFSDHGAMAELFAPDAEALAFRPGDVDALEEALVRVQDDGFVDTYGTFTRRRYEDRYTHGIATSRLEAVYRSVVEDFSTL
jgi:glycosyltransferase involved in cell wall biosynthesis